MTKERIEIIRQSLIPFVKKELLKINYEDLGESDAKEFEKDLNEVLDLAIEALEQQENKGKVALIKPSQNTTTLRQLMQPTCEDCVSRQAVLDMATTIQTDDYSCNQILDVIEVDDVKSLPPVTPTHGTCKDCKHCREDFSFTDKPVCLSHGLITVNDDFYCKDYEKRGNEND